MASIWKQLEVDAKVPRVISRVAQASSWLLNAFGMQPGGPNEMPVGGRTGSYDIFSNVRTVGLTTAPATSAAHREAQRVGKVHFDFPRMNEEMDLYYEQLHNQRILGQTAGVRDRMGTDYIRRQTGIQGQRAANWRTALLVGMLKDALYVHQQGDQWYINYTSSGSLYRINFQRPSGNLSQLDMLGDGDIIDVSWDNTNADIPGHLFSINAAMEELTGARLENVLCSSNVWSNVVKNDHVQSQAGIAGAPFTEERRVVGTKPDGTPLNVLTATLAGIPWVTWWISDEGVELGAPGSETYTKHFGDNDACFLGAISDPMKYQMLVGSEPVVEREGGAATERFGLHTWTKEVDNPARLSIFSLDNAVPADYVPSSTAYGTVIF